MKLKKKKETDNVVLISNIPFLISTKIYWLQLSKKLTNYVTLIVLLITKKIREGRRKRVFSYNGSGKKMF